MGKSGHTNGGFVTKPEGTRLIHSVQFPHGRQVWGRILHISETCQRPTSITLFLASVFDARNIANVADLVHRSVDLPASPGHGY
jgi:hypothetical protein